MNCPKCGKEVNEGSIYCPYCNYRLQNYKLYNIAALISLPISMIGGIFAIISLYSINSSTVPINDSGLISIFICIISLILSIIGIACSTSYINQYKKAAMVGLILSVLFSGAVVFGSLVLERKDGCKPGQFCSPEYNTTIDWNTNTN